MHFNDKCGQKNEHNNNLNTLTNADTSIFVSVFYIRKRKVRLLLKNTRILKRN